MSQAHLCEAQTCEFLAQLETPTDLAEAERWCQRGLNAARQVNSAAARQVEGYLRIRHATILARQGRLTIAEQEINRGIGALPRDRRTAAEISALTTSGTISSLLNKLDNAEKHWQDALEAATETNDKRRQADLLRNLAIAAEQQGTLDKAVELNRDATSRYVEIGDLAGEGYTASNLGFVHLLMGEVEEARSSIDQARQIAEERNIQDLQLFADINLARSYIQQKQFDPADELLRAVKRADEHHAPAEVLRLRAQILLHRDRDNQGQLAEALALIEQSLKAAGNNADRAWIKLAHKSRYSKRARCS